MTTPQGGPLQHEDESAYAFAGAGQLLGTSELTRAVQQFSDAVSKLAGIADDAGQSRTSGGIFGAAAAGSAAAAGGGFSGLLQAVAGVTPHGQGGGRGGRGGPGANTAPAAGGAGGTPPGGGFAALLPAGGGGWYGGGGPAGPGGPPGGPAGIGGGGPGGGGGGPGPGGGPGGGAGGGGGLGGGGFTSLLGGAGGRLAAYGTGYAWSKFSNFSNNSLGTQITMSSYLAQQMPLTSGTGRSTQQAILNQAFGSNAMAMNPQDAAAGQATLNAVSGFTATGAPGYAQPLQQGAASYNALLNYTNGASYAQSSALSSLMMSPQTGMAFLRMGLGNVAPVQIGGKVNTNAASMFEGLTGKLAPGENLNQLRYNLRSGGVVSSELGQFFPGASQQQLEMISTSMLDTSKLQQQGLSTTRINQLMQQAGSGSKSAQSTLQKYGINLTDIQAQKDVQATLTSRQADVEQGFASGLQQASANLTKFNDALNAIVKNPLVSSLLGFTSGFKAETGSQGNLRQSLLGGGLLSASNPAGSVLNTVTGGISGVVGSFFSHAFGGGASAPGATAHTATSGSGTGSTTAASVPPQAAKAVSSAESQLGVPYVWGGEQPGKGFDCSGLVQWAYEQAGVALPRTSQAQWAFLAKRQIPLNKVQEGDIVFAAGSDGTASAPGHEALVVNGHQVIQAPHTGTDVQTGPFDAAQWLYAARPAGNLSGSASGGSTTANTSSSSASGNAGAPPPTAGLDPGNYGSVDELQAVQGALLGGISAAAPGGMSGSVSTSGGSGQSVSTSGASGASSSARGGTATANQAIAKGLMKSYGWTSSQEWNALSALWERESGWSQFADTRKTGLDAPGAVVFAYGIAQARPYSKMPRAGWPADKGGQSNAGTQETWGLGYIKSSYGDPIHAEQHEQAVGWYAGGTRNARPGWSVVGERGPELLHLSGGESILNAAQSAHIAKQDAKKPMAQPYASMLGSSFSLPDMSPAASPAAAAASGTGGGAGFTLNFEPGAITLGQGVTQQDAKDFASAVGQALQGNATVQAILAGSLHG